MCEDSGYMYRFRVYTGKQDPTSAIDTALPTECAELSASEKIVAYLMLPLFDQGSTVWMENWYTSCRLYHYLHHHKTNACGTIRSKRIPPEVKNAKLGPGQVFAFRSGPGPLLCLKYRDKRDVHMLTTQHNEILVPAKKGRGRPSLTSSPTLKPMCIDEYNCNMGGVDKQEQMLHLYSIARKTMKWHKKLSLQLIHIALLNSYILYQKCGGRSSFLTFQHDVAAAFLFGDADVSFDTADKSEALTLLTERHFPDKLKPTESWSKPQARCHVCSKYGVRRDVTTFCSSCPSKLGLCSVPCFQR